MKNYDTKSIRNIAILGHLGCGKTSITEALLSISGAISTKGEVERRNTQCDPLAHSSLCAIEWKDTKINFIDLPGNEEYIGEIENALSVVDGAIIVIDASKGVEVGTERVWEEVEKRHLPAIIYVNKMDKDDIKYAEVIAQIKMRLSKSATSFALPMGNGAKYQGTINIITREAYKAGVLIDMPEEKKADVESVYNELMELAAEQEEDLMEKYLETMELSVEEISKGLHIGASKGDIFPILPGSAIHNMGIRTLLDYTLNYMPDASRKQFKATADEAKTPILVTVNSDNPLIGYVFKTVIDNYVGQISYVKMIGGSIGVGDMCYIQSIDEEVKMPAIFTMQGKTQVSIDRAQAGDIFCVAKMSEFYNGLTICSKKSPIEIEKVTHPTPVIYVAITPANKKDEDKLMASLSKLQQEDETFEIKRNPETNQMLLGGQGMTQIQGIIDQLKNMFKVEVTTADQKVVYREAIRSSATKQGRHKKQSGGAGQFGDVWIRFEPCEEEFVFNEEVFGGSVPKNYFPAVEKGIRESVQHGPLAGFPLIGIKATLTDGSYHPVDSNEISFVLAAHLAYNAAMPLCNPTILEPIVELDVTVKGDYVGTIMGDLTKRRGRIISIDAEGNKQVVKAEVPEAEVLQYAIDLKAMTQASGHFSRRFLRYEAVPDNLISKIVADSKIA